MLAVRLQWGLQPCSGAVAHVSREGNQGIVQQVVALVPYAPLQGGVCTPVQ